jgi:hypothetical protein
VSRLDFLASRMLMRARQVERALHDPGPWKVRADGIDYPARRVLGEDHITFYALIPSVRSAMIELVSGDDVVAVTDAEPMDETFEVMWQFHVEEPVAA